MSDSGGYNVDLQLELMMIKAAKYDAPIVLDQSTVS